MNLVPVVEMLELVFGVGAFQFDSDHLDEQIGHGHLEKIIRNHGITSFHSSSFLILSLVIERRSWQGVRNRLAFEKTPVFGC